mmetsp:Transcript_16613/g.28514  ORF Transcript_16613/g.28514 Transcript_16613/m.28514 type:complete len:343 (-) Transcript_16613:625-1653(-)
MLARTSASASAVQRLQAPTAVPALCQLTPCHLHTVICNSTVPFPRLGLIGVQPLVRPPRHTRFTYISPCQSSTGATPAAQPSQPLDSDAKPSTSGLALLGGFLAVVLMAAAALATPQGNVFWNMLVNGPVGKSGFLAAFSLIFFSEIGDKTFFIAALLAAKLGRWTSFIGSLTSLSVMTVISVGIGAFFSKVPDVLKSTLPVGELAGIAMLVFFGIKSLKEGLKANDGGPASMDEEQADADEAVKAAEVRRDAKPMQAFLQVASLIFIAEWGDRSMLATIALGAAQNPVGVAAGAIVGHAIATGIAVVGGALAARHVSERQINIASGVLFLVFALATGWSML